MSVGVILCGACAHPIDHDHFDEAVCWADPDSKVAAAHATCLLEYTLIAGPVLREHKLRQLGGDRLAEALRWLWDERH